MKTQEYYWDRLQEQLKKEFLNDYGVHFLSESEIQMIIDEYVDADLNELVFSRRLVN